jgi:hypothetical protein
VWVGDKEVVHVTFDPQVISYSQLLQRAGAMECTAAVYTYDARQLELARAAGLSEVRPWQEDLATRQVQKSEQKYYLRNSELAYLPLTELQAVKMNAALGEQSAADPEGYLSPRQRQLLQRVRRALQRDESSLEGFGFPEEPRQLPDYQRRLQERLAQLEP